MNLSETPPDNWMEFHERWPELFSETTEDWAPRAAKARELMALGWPPLFVYRNFLGMVWSNEDADGNCLRFLLGCH